MILFQVWIRNSLLDFCNLIQNSIKALNSVTLKRLSPIYSLNKTQHRFIALGFYRLRFLFQIALCVILVAGIFKICKKSDTVIHFDYDGLSEKNVPLARNRAWILRGLAIILIQHFDFPDGFRRESESMILVVVLYLVWNCVFTNLIQGI